MKTIGTDLNPELPAVLLHPGAEFQDDARSGAMILGMDRTPRGRIWGCWTGTGDKADGYVLLATSDDGGATWSKPRLAVGARTDAAQQLSGALVGNLWTDPRGRLWLFFDQQRGNPESGGANRPRRCEDPQCPHVLCRPLRRITSWFIRCDDPDAAEPVWSEPVRVADGCILNKPTVLQNGDWLLPVQDWLLETARVFVSTDAGGSWQERGSVKFPDWEFDEHMLVVLKDGRLWMLARTKGQPHESFSSDGGRTWSPPQPAATVQNVNTRFFLRRLTSGRILLVKNGSPAERLPQRTHLSAWLSEDEGQSWKGGLLLDERNAVSYPDGFETPDGLIHILYDWNRHTDAEILMAKFREEDVLAGKLVSKDAKVRMRANKATGPKPETLYNGIDLPDVWPPRFRDPASDAPMPVPYLVHPLRVVPIDIGRQLFVDDFLIEETTLARTFHQARKFEGNPVFQAGTERELRPASVGYEPGEAATYTGHGGMFYDPADKRFKLFYTAGWRGPLSLATSPDLKTWTRQGELLPEGLRWTGSKLATGGSDNCVWLDLNAKNPAERLKFLTCWLHVPWQQHPQGFSHSLHVSDGKTWSDAAATTLVAADYCSFFYNPFRGKWAFSIKMNTVRGRSRYYFESGDFLQGVDWAKAVYWTSADRRDRPEPEGGYPGAGEPAQLYSLNAVAYESLMVGMHHIHRGPSNEICEKGRYPKLIDLELGFSRDGFHWDRPERRPFIAGSRTEGSWDRGYLHSTAGVFVVLDDQLVFPYTGFSGIAPNGNRGMYTGGSLGLATLRRDGFASMDAGPSPATLTTRPITFSGEHLFVNLDAPQGELRVEVLTPDNKNHGSFTAEQCLPLSGNSTRQRVVWRSGGSLACFKNQPVKLRFTLTNGSLYAFWVTSDPNGASHGYVGAGGPGDVESLDVKYEERGNENCTNACLFPVPAGDACPLRRDRVVAGDDVAARIAERQDIGAARIAERLKVPLATLPVLKDAPALDAAPDFKNWAGPLAFQNLTGFGHKPPVETRGYLATDGKNVYLAVRCEDPAAQKIASAPVPLDGNVWAADAAEFMLLPGHAPDQPYYHFAVNPAGSLYDAKGKDKTWNSGAKVISVVDTTGWLAVIRVPLQALGVKEGELPALWRVNLHRYRPARGAPELDLAWSPTWSNQNHVPACFGLVSFNNGKPLDAAAIIKELTMKTQETNNTPFQVTPELLDRALETPRLNTSPLPEYGYDRIDYGMTMSLERTPQGRLWAAWVGGGDSEKGFFVLASSDDDGETWSQPRLVIDPHDAGLPCARRALIGPLWTDPLGRLWLFFDQSLRYFDGRAGDWFTRCDDPDAETPHWTEPQRLWHGSTSNKPIVLANGDWLLPVSLWTREWIDKRFRDCFTELDNLRMAHVFASSDQGRTWSRRGSVAYPNPQFDEHMLVQRRDGSLWMLARTCDSIWESFSNDAGVSWSQPQRSAIDHIRTRFHIRRLRSGRLLLVKHGARVDERTERRTHLTAFLSDDDGLSWRGGLLLDERHEVSYPDGTQAPDGMIYVSYDRNRATDGQILLARFTEDDVLAGRLVSPRSKLQMQITRAGAH